MTGRFFDFISFLIRFDAVADNNTRIWSFHLKDYELLLDRVSPLNPDVVIGTLPKFVLNLLNQPKNEPDQMCLAAIEPKLRNALMGFQIEGVCFGIDKGGRCMIADDMGLGKISSTKKIDLFSMKSKCSLRQNLSGTGHC